MKSSISTEICKYPPKSFYPTSNTNPSHSFFSFRYFEGGVSSVYCWDLDDGFAACILIKKSTFSPIIFFLSIIDIICIYQCAQLPCYRSLTWLILFPLHITAQDQSKKGQPMKGTWDSIHVVEVQDNKRNAHYKLTSTVMLSIETETNNTGQVSLAGSLTRQVFIICNSIAR